MNWKSWAYLTFALLMSSHFSYAQTISSPTSLVVDDHPSAPRISEPLIVENEHGKYVLRTIQTRRFAGRLEGSGFFARTGQRVLSFLTKSEAVYYALDEPQTREQKDSYEAMTPDDRLLFQSRRLNILQQLIAVLNTQKLIIGPGGLVGGQIVQFFKDNLSPNMNIPPRSIYQLDSPAPPPDLSVEMAHQLSEKWGLSREGHSLIQEFINMFNDQMWENSLVIKNANELTLSALMGGNGGLKVKNYGIYPQLCLGLSFTYNFEQRKYFFDFIADPAYIDRAYPFVAQATLMYQFFLSAGYRPQEEVIRGFRGRGLNLPGPFMAMKAEKSMGIGLSQGGIGAAWPPYADFLYTYTSKFFRISALSFSINTLDGFPKLGDFHSDLVYLIGNFPDIYRRQVTEPFKRFALRVYEKASTFKEENKFCRLFFGS